MSTSTVEQREDAFVKKLLIALALVILVGGGIAFFVTREPDKTAVLDTAADPSIGPETATVVVKEYADFQCPGCASTYPVVDELIAQYGDKIRFVYNDFPLPQHAYASDASIAGECAFQQNKFFDYHHLLFDNQRTWEALPSAEAAQQQFLAYAQELSLDMNAFGACVTGVDAAAHVNEDIAEGKALRVNSTPTFFVNGVAVTKTPFSQYLKEAIDNALAE